MINWPDDLKVSTYKKQEKEGGGHILTSGHVCGLLSPDHQWKGTESNSITGVALAQAPLWFSRVVRH